MEELTYIMLIAACAVFIVNTIVRWVRSAKFEAEHAVREVERRVRMETFDRSRLEALEKFQEKVEKQMED